MELASSMSDKALVLRVLAGETDLIPVLSKRWGITPQADKWPEVVTGFKRLRVPSVTAAKKIMKSHQ